MLTKGMLRDRARGMRKQQSRAEEALWELVRGRKIAGAKFRRQHPAANYIADFACVDAKLIVEVDGLSHTIPEQITYDAERDRVLTAQGWRILRIKDSDILTNAHAVVARIERALAQ